MLGFFFCVCDFVFVLYRSLYVEFVLGHRLGSFQLFHISAQCQCWCQLNSYALYGICVFAGLCLHVFV